MEKWIVIAEHADFMDIARQFSIDPVLARLIRNRDIVASEEIKKYLYGGLLDLYPPEQLKGIRKAGKILLQKIRERKLIRVIGDYDIDGVMSAYILQTGLKRLGAICNVRMPERIKDGYGLNENLVRQAFDDSIDTIVTCDNGIIASAPISLARELGMSTVVTDHHEVSYSEQEDGTREYILPPADAVINPKQPGCSYPFKEICGAAIAWKLICYLYNQVGIEEKEQENFLEFVCLATVGDVMDLQDENRILVKEGLKRLRRTKNLGIQALIKQNGLEPLQIDVHHIGFVLGPCLNASGRLDTAKRTLDLLTAESREESERLARDLKAMNEKRKGMTEQGVEEAVSLVESTSLIDDKVLVIYLPNCHESLAGIIAGRLKEYYHRPSFVLTGKEEGTKGSGRSIEVYSMYEELCKCREYIIRFGGHPMAAGICMEKKNIPLFRERINQLCELTEEDIIPQITIDAPMSIRYVNRKLLEQIALLKPFGKGNPRPLFIEKKMKVLNQRIFGKNRNVVKMQVMNENGYAMNGIYFGNARKFSHYVAIHSQLSLVYYPSINSHMGHDTLQIIITNYR